MSHLEFYETFFYDNINLWELNLNILGKTHDRARSEMTDWGAQIYKTNRIFPHLWR